MKTTYNNAAMPFVSRILLAGISFCIALGAARAQSPYIDRVYDFRPAPGQFVNDLPEYEQGDTQADMNRKAGEAIANNNRGMISLGGYGGYVVFGFDHMIENVRGRYDFRILGNAFYADANPDGGASREGGSCEPGVVMVSRDVNGNGLPDDAWYELAGSDYRKPQTIHGYEITYLRPDPSKPPVAHPTDRYLNDIEYIRWTTNGHGDGYLYRNTYHSQPYYPQWVEAGTLTFRGMRLAPNAVDESGEGRYYVQYASHWGYADNHPNDDNRSGFSIEWAVDDNGGGVDLPGIDFVKVYTAVNQNCGWIGETSTEILGAEDLHLTGGDAIVPVFVSSIALDRSSLDLEPGQSVVLAASITPSDASNDAVTWRSLAPEVAVVNNNGQVTALAAGEALVQAISNDGYYIAECRVTVDDGQVGPKPDGTNVTGLRLDRNSIDLRPGDVAQLTADVIPATAVDKSVRWSTSNPEVADVTAAGRVYAFAAGEAIITATTVDGGYTAACSVTVSTSSAASPATGSLPQAYFAEGRLRLLNLEGYACTVFSLRGGKLAEFRAASPDDRRACNLSPGVYILAARKDGHLLTFKIISR